MPSSITTTTSDRIRATGVKLETHAEAFASLLPTVEDAAELAIADGGEDGMK